MNDFSQAAYTKGSISDLRGAKMGGPQFALLEKRTYAQALALGIEWDNEWIPKGVTKKPTSSTTDYLKIGDKLTLGKHQCTVDKGSDGYFLSGNDVQNDELFTQFGLTNQDIRSFSGEGKAEQTFPEMLSRKRLTEVYHWLKGYERKENKSPDHSDVLRYDKMISYLCSRISELRTTCQLSIHDRNAADNFLQYIRDNQHSQMYRAAKWISETCNRYGVTWAPGMSINELKDYLEYNFPFSEIKGSEGVIEVRPGNPCVEIALGEPQDCFLPYPSDTEELNPLHLI
jgi:hypothetical protein